MAHGAGGKATSKLVEGLLQPAFGMALGDAALVGDVAITTDAFVVKPLRFPGGSIGELAVNGTVNDLAMAGARPEALTLSLILEEGLDSDVLRAEVDAIARAAEAAGVRIVGGDTKVVERGHADGMYITTTGLGRRRPARGVRDAAARRPDPALRPDRRARHGDHARARRVRARSRHRLRHAVAVAGGRRHARAGRPPAARRHPRRRRLRPERARARRRRRDADPARRRCRSRPRSPARASCSGSTRCTSPTRASSSRSSRPTWSSPGFADIGEIKTEPPGMVLVETSFGGKRVMDELVGDPLPRIC